jgi:hypothetical protein
MSRLPALSLYRPWPALFFHSGKDVENRPWPTHYRGDLLIAAAKGCDPKALAYARDLARLDHAHGREHVIDLTAVAEDPREHPLGIIGVVELYDVCAYARAHPGELCDCSPWATPGQMHWKLRNPRLFPQPVPHSGSQRLWAVDEQAWPAVVAQLRAVNRQTVN